MPSKYRNLKIVRDGEKFDSIAEYRRYNDLLRLQKIGIINNIVRQPVFVLAPKVSIQGKNKPALRYIADFSYEDSYTGEKIVEDVKGMLTDVYKIKRHLMKSVHGIDILETK